MFAYTIALMFVNLTGPIERGELAFFWMFVTGMWVFALVAAYILDTLRGTVHRVEKGKEGGR
jgi:ABC-type arginine transport system permease subunit